MNHFNTKQGCLFYDYALHVEQSAKIRDFLSLLDESGVAEIIEHEQQGSTTGRPEYPTLNMFACILYGFAMRSATLRELESSCRYDTRFMYIMDGMTPSYASFSRYINGIIKPRQDEIFQKVTKAILGHFGVDLSDCYMDGSKFEADANKYKFVWKPTKLHENLSDKVRNLLVSMGIQRGIPSTGIIPSSMIAEKITEASSPVAERGTATTEKAWASMIRSLTLYLEKALDYEEKERICGPNRNSYYKTDRDATAMCLKQDYYSGLGSNMHAAYNVQFVISAGFIATYYISQDRNDIYTFVPTMERFRGMYGFLPARICADSGYGYSNNYDYCERNGIKAFIKYPAWEGECSGRRPALYEMDDDGNITCLGGRTGVVAEVPGRHHKVRGALFYQVSNCLGCQFMPYCRQYMKESEGESRIFEINPVFQMQKQKARDLLLSVEGIEMRVNRSCQSEGGFGIVKQDLPYPRLRRTGLPQVGVEFMLTVLARNIRRFLKYSGKDLKLKYWTAPKGTETEKFRKPSAKRLSNRVTRQRKKSVNETARDYKYK